MNISIMKKIYFLILSTIIIGFVVGVIFELDRKKSSPAELIEKIPKFVENLITPTTTTVRSSKKGVNNISKAIVHIQNMISEIEQNLKNLKNIKDNKKRIELCKKILNSRKVIKQNYGSIKGADRKLFEQNMKEFRKIVNKIRRFHCYSYSMQVEKKKNGQGKGK